MDIRDLFNLENNKSFQQLNQKVNSFNTLKTLRLVNYEIRHSNILVWLLNSRENHNLGDYFLRKLLEQIILIDENEDNSRCNLIEEILNNSLVESHVFREVKTNNNRYIDLVVINKQLKYVILIENKLYSTESENQLDDYLEFVQNEFENFKIIPIYLTLNGEMPSNLEYFTLSYENIENILHIILILFKDKLADDIYQFIEDYDNVLKEKLHPDEEQILQAIDVYRSHKEIIEELFEESSITKNPLYIEIGYKFEFMTKYKNTIDYIFKHGKNILSYSFEQFITEHFDNQVNYKPHPTLPYLLPPEWKEVKNKVLLDQNYWLGKGLVVWFEQTNDSRLRIVAELGPLEYKDRISFIRNLEDLGVKFNDNSKRKQSRYTRFFIKKIDINKWDNIDELKAAMKKLYTSSEFNLLKKQVTLALGDNLILKEDTYKTQGEPELIEEVAITDAFKAWMKSENISENNYRVSSQFLSFKISLFDEFKEMLGETRIKWWWNNGPFLFWMKIKPDSLYFTLEVGPIETENRVVLMENIKEKGIKFRKQGLRLEAKYTRIYSKTISINDFEKNDLSEIFDNLYNNSELQSIISKLKIIYDEMYKDFND